jgi:hypothetical protein
MSLYLIYRYYNESDWDSTGSKLVTEMALRHCKTSEFQDKLYTPAECNNATMILPSTAFYPFSRKQWNEIFRIHTDQLSFRPHWKKAQEGHAVHLWSHESSRSKSHVLDDKSQVMAALVKENCPGTYTFMIDKQLKPPL